MRVTVQLLFSALCVLLLATCTHRATVSESADPVGLERPASAPAAPEAVPVEWCDGPASNLQTALADSVGGNHFDPQSLERSFNDLMVALRQAQSDAPPELDLTLASAVENLEDMIRLLEEYSWERSIVDADRLTRINARFEGAVWALDDYTIDECGFNSGLLSPASTGIDPTDWCNGRALEIQLALLQVIALEGEDAATLQRVYVQLSDTLATARADAPDEFEVILASTTDNLDNTLRYIEDMGWVLDDVTRFELRWLHADFYDLFGRLDEYRVVQCGVESDIVLPPLDLDEPFDAVAEPDAEPDFDPSGDDEPVTAPLTETELQALRPDIAQWELVTSTPELGIGDRMSAIAPFPTSHVVPASSINRLDFSYSPGSVYVWLQYHSSLSLEDTVTEVTEQMLQSEGSFELDESSGQTVTATSELLQYEDSLHEVNFYDSGDGVVVDASFSIGTLSAADEAALVAQIAGWHRGDWPDPPESQLGWSEGYYEWSPDYGVSINSYSQYGFLVDMRFSEAAELFEAELTRAQVEWDKDTDDDYAWYFTPEWTSCVELYRDGVYFSTNYWREDQIDIGC